MIKLRTFHKFKPRPAASVDWSEWGNSSLRDPSRLFVPPSVFIIQSKFLIKFTTKYYDSQMHTLYFISVSCEYINHYSIYLDIVLRVYHNECETLIWEDCKSWLVLTSSTKLLFDILEQYCCRSSRFSFLLRRVFPPSSHVYHLKTCTRRKYYAIEKKIKVDIKCSNLDVCSNKLVMLCNKVFSITSLSTKGNF